MVGSCLLNFCGQCLIEKVTDCKKKGLLTDYELINAGELVHNRIMFMSTMEWTSTAIKASIIILSDNKFSSTRLYSTAPNSLPLYSIIQKYQ